MEIPVNDESLNARLRDRIDAAKARNAAQSAIDSSRKVIEEHPIAALAGGILIGALIARALPRSVARTPARKFGKSALSLATVASELAIAYAAKAAEAGRGGVDRLEDLGGSVGGKVVEGGAEARRVATDIAGIARAGFKEASEVALRHVSEIAAKVRK
jgi:hypothetical protein